MAAPMAPVGGDRTFSVGPFAAFGTLAFGGTAAVLLLFTFFGFPLAVTSQSSVAEASLPGQPETALTLPDYGSDAELESFSQADGAETADDEAGSDSTASDSTDSDEFIADAVRTTGIFSRQGSGDRLASYLVYEQMVLTSASSLDGRSTVWLALSDVWIKATVVGVDRYTDIAVLEPAEWLDGLTENASQPTTAEDGDRVQLDPLLGADLGDDLDSIWSGVVSVADDMATTADGYNWYDVLALSVPSDGLVPGSAVVAESGDTVGMAINVGSSLTMAIPFQTLAEVAQSLTTTGQASQAWLGVEVTTGDNGETRLVAIHEASPANGILETGDIIFSANGVAVTNANYLLFVVRQVGPGADLKLVIRRDGILRQMTIVTGTVPDASSS